MNETLQIDPRDDVVVALRDLASGHQLPGDVTVCERIPAKQKVALRDFSQGERITMYGVLVGRATRPIPAGGRLSTENLRHDAEDFQVRESQASTWAPPDVSAWENATFRGFHRPNGQVGTANHWIVVPLVFCENRNLETMREAVAEIPGYGRSSHYARFLRKLTELRRSGAGKEEILAETLPNPDEPAERMFRNVDGVKFLRHESGCGETDQDCEALCGLLAGYITHPNVGGVTVLSLGCQKAQVEMLEREIAKRDPSFNRPFEVFTQQKSASERDMIAAALKQLFIGLDTANEAERKPAPLSKLTFGMECGGSDGFSGISANPAIGQVSDLIVALGGRTILAEFPELCGVEQEILDRCAEKTGAERFAGLMRTYAQRAEEAGSALHMNPSPGNIADGLITDAIKSAGAAKKGGTSPVRDVLDYPEQVSRDGLSLLCTPGSDVESTTAMAGAGANIMLFSTGLGTPTGNAIVPTLKVSSNSELAQRMSDIIDFDTGPVIRGEATIADLGAELLELAIQTASGEYTPRAVSLGQDDFLPWKRGVSL